MVYPALDCFWNVMAHGDARAEKWRRNKRMDWVTSKRHMTAEHRLARAVQTLQADWTDSPPPPPGADLNGIVRFAERRNLVAALVPSHFKRSLLPLTRTARLLVVDWTDAPADLNGLVRFAERRNLVSARVPLHSNAETKLLSFTWCYVLCSSDGIV